LAPKEEAPKVEETAQDTREDASVKSSEPAATAASVKDAASEKTETEEEQKPQEETEEQQEINEDEKAQKEALNCCGVSIAVE
jgi:hypothetical protein